MPTHSSTRRNLIALAGTAAAAIAVAAVWLATREEVGPPPPLPTLKTAIRRQPAPAPPATAAETSPTRAELEAQFARLQAQIGKDHSPLSGSGRVDMYWPGKRSEDPGSNPKVMAYLKKHGITNPEKARDWFPYQWQVEFLEETGERFHR
jgi:hypothetical protein